MAQTNRSLNILFADDEVQLRMVMESELPRMGHRVTVCPDGLTAVQALSENSFDCMIVDLDMPGLSGIEVIEQARKLAPETDAIVLTGRSSLQTAIEALRLGAFDYLQKPARLVEIGSTLERLAQSRELSRKVRALERQLVQGLGTPEIIGIHSETRRLRELITKFAPTDSAVMILGETGCGKDLVARALHTKSLRKEMPFVKIDCGTLSPATIDVELFGERIASGSGSTKSASSAFELAQGGSLFLDDIGSLPLEIQGRILGFLETGEIQRSGDLNPIRLDVRILCASRCDLQAAVAQSSFREDLYFRINTIEIRLSPLRMRSDDVQVLAEHFLRSKRQGSHKGEEGFTTGALQILTRHSWPGNVRELENVIDYATILSDGSVISTAHLPPRLTHDRGTSTREVSEAPTLIESVFVSHSTLDRETVERDIVNFLQSHGIRTWFAGEDINSSDEWERSIVKGLQECEWFIVAMSANSASSRWVRSEVHWAMQNRYSRIIPILLEDCDPLSFHLMLSQIQHITLHESTHTAQETLLALVNSSTP